MSRTARRLLLPALMTGGLVAATLTQPALAAPGTAAPQRACPATSDLDAAATESDGCLAVTGTLSAAPAVGGRAVLEVTVTAQADLTGVRLSAALPPSLRWVRVPAGLTAGRRAAHLPLNHGSLAAAGTTLSLVAGRPVRYRGVVQAVSAGAAAVDLTATAPAGISDAGAVLVTVGTTAATSHLGIATADHLGTMAASGPAPRAETSRVAKPTALERRLGTTGSVRRAAAGRPGVRTASGTACATGSWSFVDGYGDTYAAAGWKVEAWDRDTASAHDLLATGTVGDDGSYDLCFNNADDGTAGNDVYMKFTADSGNWRVDDNTGTTYAFTTGVDGDVLDGQTADFGALQPDPDLQPVGQIFKGVRDTWYALPGACWDMNSTCRPVVHRWGLDSGTTGVSNYSPAGNYVRLKLDGPRFYTTIIHESGHAIMDDVYDDHFPAAPNCNPHSFTTASSTGCAWTEGFADWLPNWVYGANSRTEDGSWDTPSFADGDDVEGRVAGSLNDLVDGNDDGLDTYTEGISPVWTTFQNHNSTTFAQFWADRTADGFDVGQGPLAALFQNTIDYGYIP